MRRIKFLNRTETNYILIIEKDLKDKDFMSLFRDARKEGEFDVDFHFLVHRDGLIEEGRSVDVVGGLNVKEEEDAVIVFVDVPSYGENDVQSASLSTLVTMLQEKYPGAVTQKIVV